MKRFVLILPVMLAVAIGFGAYFYPEFRAWRHPFPMEKAPLRLVEISPGSFIMGSDRGEGDEKPIHKVTLTKTFYMGATEVTQAQYFAVMGTKSTWTKGEDLPTEYVSWNDAVEFCGKLTETERKKGNLPDGMGYRLPTEAEWEYCCRAGNTGEYCFGYERELSGEDPGLLNDYAWFGKNSESRAHPVGAKKPNAWGLYDMHGNVWEWCYDRYTEMYPPRADGDQVDPAGPPTGDSRVLRGGSWLYDARHCRSSFRFRCIGGSKSIGFRVVVAGVIALEEALKAEEARKAEEIRKTEEARRKASRTDPFLLVAIYPGSFLMGSDKGSEDQKPVHRVNITRAFYMGATEVTQRQFRTVMGTKSTWTKGEDLPTEYVSWNDAVEFCSKLTETERKKGNLPDGMVYRLPTEAEWEYCCRAGSTTKYCCDDDGILLGDYAWTWRNSEHTTHPVGTKKPNAWGLYDMHGNLQEFCYDWYGIYPAEAGLLSDPTGPETGDSRVLRGGGRTGNEWTCSSASRDKMKPAAEGSSSGFRVVLGPPIVP